MDYAQDGAILLSSSISSPTHSHCSVGSNFVSGTKNLRVLSNRKQNRGETTRTHFPWGNGFLGAMVFGGVKLETLQLNEKSLWSGSPDDNNNPEAAESLGKIRQLLFEKRYREANGSSRKNTGLQRRRLGGRGSGANAPYGSSSESG